MSRKAFGLLAAVLCAAACASTPRDRRIETDAREVRLVTAVDEVATCRDLGPISGRDVPGVSGWETMTPARAMLRRNAALAGADTVLVQVAEHYAGGARASADSSRSAVAGRAYFCGARPLRND